MGDEEQGKGGAGGPDTRMEWMRSRVISALRMKDEKFDKLMATEEGSVITNFLDSNDTTRILIFDNGKGELSASASPPQKFKKKSVFFVKLLPQALQATEMDQLVLYGDLGDIPLEQLSAVAQEVFLPLLSNPRNQDGWPEVVTKEVLENMHKFIANVYVTIGQTKGKTLLPLPPADGPETGDKTMRDKDRIHVLESAVVTWTRQIKNVLKIEPDQALKDGSNPGPLTELEFWAAKSSNLNAIHDQLNGPKIQKVLQILELSKSTYHPGFDRLCREVAAARVEANDNVKFLAPLQRYFEKLNMADEFPALVELFKPIIHTLMLIWKHGKHYNTAARLVVLMREISNDLIMQACKFVEGNAIFESPPQEAVEKLRTTLRVCGSFKSYYFEYKLRTQTECEENPWRFQNSALFARLDAFLERCHDILDLTQTMLQFSKLEKVEIGGTKGKPLTASVRQIYSDFQQAVAKFNGATYDILDVEVKQFDDDFYEFRVVIKELERRLASVITQAFDDCSTVGTTFKLLDSFEGLLEREIIQADLEKKHMDLLRAYGADVKEVHDIFANQSAAPNVPKNNAPHSGACAWVRALKERVSEPMEKLKELPPAVLESEEGREIMKLYDSLMTALAKFEQDTVEEWAKQAEATGDERLKQSLLRRDDADGGLPFLAVNFDPMITRLLREVKYFLLLNVEVPPGAHKIFKRGETLRQQTGNLELITGIYNDILRTLLPVERPLIEKKLEAVDAALTKGLTVLNWNSHHIDGYIQELMAQVKEVDTILKTIKGNVEQTQKILSGWSKKLMFERKDGKTYSVEEFREFHKGVISARHQEVQEGAVEITRLLSASNKTLKCSKGSPHWRAYVEYVNDIVMDGFCQAILASVNYLFQQIDPETMAKAETPPLIEVGLELIAPEIAWQPEIGQDGQGGGVRDMFNSWIKGFLHIGTLMKRLDIGEGNYVLELEEDFQLMDAISAVQNVVLANERACMDFKNSYMKYDYLWKKDLHETLNEFLAANGVDGGDPLLEKFDEEIARYKALQEEIQNLPAGLTIGWIRIDAKPIKHALLTWVNKWVNLYTHFLSNKVVSTMDDLYTFIAASGKVLETADPSNAELDQAAAQRSLYEVMATMRDIRKRTDKTDNMFDPLRQTVTLLKNYGVMIGDATLKKLEEGPMAWADLKKKSLNMRERLAEQQQQEARIIRQKSDDFMAKVEKFRSDFLARAPFSVSAEKIKVEDVAPAYEVLDAYRHGEVTDKFPLGSVTNMVAQGRALNEAQELFEIYTVDYIALRRCEEEMTALKLLWDMIGSVMYQFVEWNQTPWDKIDVDYLVEESKKLQKDIKGLNKSVRNFEAYKTLEDQVKALLTSLPLVSDLHHPSMRDRHWKLLMKTTGKNFVMDEKFNLGNLLALELHQCVDAVSEIVERAQKELVIEKALKKIEETWASLNLAFQAFHDSEVLNLIVDEGITETLEGDNLQLQTMSSGKYVQGNPKFLEAVSSWQKKLGTVDSVLTVWRDVCKKWQALESIFVGSADIRVQLPEDSKRFDGVNVEFIALMTAAPDIVNVVDACNLEGRQEQLENMLNLLELCEKALQDYLETKRIAFPRFYFVAPADLLDILSKGTNPQLILKHLAKCFDNVHNLEFTKADNGTPTKYAIGMYSGEKEYVVFDAPCHCDGPVEVWLQNVVDSMRQALRVEFRASIVSYDEKPRTKWLFDQSAQNTIMVSRVFYTQEMNEAFEQMEEGNESALKDFYGKQLTQLAGLIELINGELSGNDRKKIVTLCTIDVHARDVVQRLIDARVESINCFEWASQLRYSQNEKSLDSQINICDAEVAYGYEYIGNCGCLVITPLTDRCYITLTQAQRLVLGGAPAGPAGTGKTESVKDLGRALGYQVYVFNCSDQMDYRAMGQTYKGLAQTGAWGCFDEFNRIPVAVLSVCSTQYKTVLDAIRARKQRFMFEEVEISLRPTCMAFITMNPGYPGRAELPESLKALFRPVSMCVPDLSLICEIMLMAEGFLMSKILARKFVILYKLCEDLLSKAPHYDWKLRAIKTTLYVAGGLKRGQPHLSEDKVLLQALRDFNLGKLTSDDHGIFMGLLNDLFPKTVDLVPRRVDKRFEDEIKKAALELNLQPEDTFVLKITQLREIFEVRWSVFLLGPAGCGKTTVWRTLMRAQNNAGEKTQAKPINPKSVTRNELYGYLHPTTREWKEGLISVTYRDMANNTNFQHQWIVLDGDIDAEWIESMNTVMDDNKMLTLASNERIPLTPSMRLLLEINHMIHCSPATVSRGGVIYLNAEDIGWTPVVESWIHNREDKAYRPLLTELFDKYVEKSMEHCRRNFKTIVPLVAVNIAQTICKILEGILPEETVRGGPPPDRKLLEAQFVFACVWAIGGCMVVDKVVDYRTQFSKWWASEWKAVFYPDKGQVFDYYVDEKTAQMVPWEDRVQSFSYNAADGFATMFVPTVETTRLSYFLDSLIGHGHYVMFVGNAGTGKTALMRDKLKSMDQETTVFSTLNFNNFMDASALQVILEQPLEKKSGVRFGPPGAKKLIYFIDDFNMPYVDKYDTQSPIELARQFVDYRGWYDKVKIVLKEVLNCYYTGCMNPTAGSFTITPRMQRHFATFAVQMPSSDIVRSIYLALVEGHMKSFDPDVSRLAPKLVDATVELHRLVSATFLPSAVKFHYQFNLRDLSNIVQGMCRMMPEYFSKSLSVVRLWVHECERVFLDRMVNQTDITKMEEMRLTVTRKYFEDEDIAAVEARPIIYNSFMKFTQDEVPVYYGCDEYAKLNKVLVEKLNEHNESRPVMDLVLFNQAMEHVCRIARIIDLPRGNAMLVGVGGSGKQSLAKLASFICNYEVFQISVTSSYGVAEFKVDLLSLYTKTGVKGIPMVFLMTDGQIVNERFLVYINDLLSSGYIPDLMTQEDKDNMCNAVRPELKQTGAIDSPENLWDFFLDKVRKLLHVVLCFSPVGDKFRIRARNFPALINNTAIDWFQPWPHEALVSVAGRFLADVENIAPEIMENMQFHMAFLHISVTEASQAYLDQVRRFNYTTPKSYLELIALYKQLLDLKRTDLRQQRERLESGVEKIAQASSQVADLQLNLKQEQIIVEEKKAATDALIVSIGQEKAVVDEAVASGKDDEEACAAIAAEVSAFQAECEEDLKAAEPIIAEAEAALNSLDKKSLGELKSFGSPAAEVVQVAAACMVLTSPGGKISKDLSWNAAKKFMGNVDGFLQSLVNFDKDNTPEVCVKKVETDYLSNPNFNPDFIRNKSGAAAGLCAWVVNICKYFRIYQVVAPKRALLSDANKKLDAANKKLTGIRAKVRELQDRVTRLEESLMKATEDKNMAIAAAEKTQRKAQLADRLVNGLSGENKRWGEAIEKFGAMERRLVGDVMVAAAFVSYAGPFNSQFRTALVFDKWIPDLKERQIPMTDSIVPLDLLASDAQKAMWGVEGLPTDPLSVENGAIMTNAARWSLMIDPQLQGIAWIRNRETKNGLKIIQLSTPKYIDTVENCIENGIPLLIENLQDDIDAVLDPVVARQTIKRGRNLLMKLGDKEVTYDPNFRLYLQTKLSNPHYKPEIAAQTTLVNFCVTEKGLEDQLLALVVEKERPDLQEQAASLVRQLGEFTIQLKDLEDNLLFRLANSQGDILDDIELIENLEETKRTAVEIETKVAAAKDTEKTINTAREVYRPVATRGSLVYFLIDSLWVLDRVYQYSMANFVYILKKGIDVTPGGPDESKVPEQQRRGEVSVEKRVELLVVHTTYTVFTYIASGLFERHKLIVASQLVMSVLKQRGELSAPLFNYLLKGPKVLGHDNPLSEWVSDSVWASVQALREIEEYQSLSDDLIGSAKRWREWMELERPEDEPMPGDWKKMSQFQQLLLFRAIRPDRMSNALSSFVKEELGPEYITSLSFNLERSFEDAAPAVPIFIFLSPGVDVAAAVEAMGTKMGFSYETGKYASVSLGQGQEPIAMNNLNNFRKEGGWLLLQNIHLTIDWTNGPLEKVVDKLSEGTHAEFRLFLSAEPPPALEKGLAISLLQNSIKLTNEPPQGMKQNLVRAYGNFTEEMFESCAKQAEYKAIVFALCYFHAALLERKKFGVGNMPGATSGIGWNMNYPFNCFPEDHQILTEFGFYSLRDVRAHFARHTHLKIACYVDGRLEYHAITWGDVTINTGKHTLIEMEDSNTSHKKNNVSLTPTANHRMWVRMGPTVKNKTRAFYPAKAKSPYNIQLASEVMQMGREDPTAAVQFQAKASEGVVPMSQDLPFTGPLDLTTPDETDAFLELYGYWTGDGYLDVTSRTIGFCPVKVDDWDYLDKLFHRLRRVLPKNSRQGVVIDARPGTKKGWGKAIVGVKQRYYLIYKPSWWAYFAAEYEVKYQQRRGIRGGGARSAPEEAHKEEVLAAHQAKRKREDKDTRAERLDTGDDGASAGGVEGGGARAAAAHISDASSAKWFWYWVLRNLNRQQARLVLKGLQFADGDQATDRSASGGGYIGTSSTRFRDEILHLAMHAGYSAHFVVNYKAGSHNGTNKHGVDIVANYDHYKVSYIEARGSEPKLTPSTECKETQFEGTVWCVTVPTKDQLIVVRRVLEADENGIKKASRPLVVGNTGDLLCCAQTANNYLENNSKVPWDDLKYLFGEILYGGHIVEDWDRRLAYMYLELYMREDLLEGIEMFPRFSSPPSGLSHKSTLEYISEVFPTESPLAFGLHPNAEIGFKLREAESLCASLLLLQPRESGGEAGASVEDKAKMVLDDVVERLPENFDVEDIRGRVDEVTPYVMVAIQEVERMNVLLSEIKRSLAELDLGLKGDLTMTDPMEVVMRSLANDVVPPSWAKNAWPSLRPLGSWLQNLQQRITQLSDWTSDLTLPKVTWLSGLFNPQSFLTAVMQTTARRNDWPLDKTVVLTEVTKKQVDQIEAPSRDGAFIHGLTLEGARWDDKTGVLEDSKPKELFCPMPVILIKAVTVDKAEMKDAYQTPVYKTERRFREEVFTAQLKSKHGQIKWTLAGVCLFLDVV